MAVWPRPVSVHCITFMPFGNCSFIGSRLPLAVHRPLAEKCSTEPRRLLWRGVVGLEVHAQIASKSKLFSGSGISYGAPVNTQVSFFDAALPGTLPVLNRRCVEAAVAAAVALRCHINALSRFDRKHYFYADMPAGYQITQHKSPIARGGCLEYVDFSFGRAGAVAKMKEACITQIQLEQDSGKSLYDASAHQSLVDLNRAGVGLMEIITEPNFSTGDEAAGFVRELQSVLKIVGACDGKMEEGSLRVDANVSVHRAGEPLGVRVEVKNLNSFKHVAAAVDYEISRQTSVLTAGHRVVNETRSFDHEKKATVAMRDKEKQQDYRIMPEPNLPPLCISVDNGLALQCGGGSAETAVSVARIASTLPELPAGTRMQLRHKYGLSLEHAYMLMSHEGLLELFVGVCDRSPSLDSSDVCRFVLKQLLGFLNDHGLAPSDGAISLEQGTSLCEAVSSGFITDATAKKVMELWHDGGELTASLEDIVSRKNWQKIVDASQIRAIARRVIDANFKMATQCKRKKHKFVFNKLMTKFMDELEQRADFLTAAAIMEEEINNLP